MAIDTLVTAQTVHDTLRKHLLVDGFEFVLDLKNSKNGYLRDAVSGQSFLDFFTFFASNPVGLNHPKLLDEAFVKKMGHIAIHNPSNSDLYTQEMAEFVSTFSRVGIPSYMPYAFFVAGGALAVENALKVAFDWKVQMNFRKGYRTERGHRILHFQEAFHGRTGYTMSLTNTDPNKVKYYPKFDWPRILNPKMRFPMTEEVTHKVIADEKLAIAQAERYFEMYKDDIAAIILEPIQGEGGVRPLPGDFLRALRALCDERDLLLFYDEVQCGLGRTGGWCGWHAAGAMDAAPDAVSWAKGIGGGFPLGAFWVREKFANLLGPGTHGTTYGGSPLACAASNAVFDTIEKEDLLANARARGAQLTAAVQNLPHVREVRGAGLLLGVEVENLPPLEGEEGPAALRLTKRLIKAGLLVVPAGEQTIRLLPPLNVTAAECEEAAQILHDVLAESRP